MIFNLQRYSVQDGPGIRTTVFLKGCPLRCAWCHNAEGISHEREILILANRCLGCQECRKVCPFASDEPGTGPMPTRTARCIVCGNCVEACPSLARQIVGREVSVPQLLKELLRDRVFYEDSGGGVTFSGGEPLAQPEFLLSMLQACKQEGLHTAVDTCGLAATRDLLAIVPFTDLFLYDLKLMDEAHHRKFTGASNALILSNLECLSRSHPQIWIRIPVVPGVNDAHSNFEATARFAARLASVRQVNLLPYHRTGVTKFQRVGRESRLPATMPPSEFAMRHARQIFEQEGLTTHIGG